MNLSKHNHFTIYNALPYNMKFSNKQQREQPKVIGVVSRLEPIKGMDLVVPAFAEVKKHHPEAKLIVVGDGTQLELMKQQAEMLRVMDSIEWLVDSRKRGCTSGTARWTSY